MLGMAYKKDIDDLRESPSLTVIELLREQGAEVRLQRSLLPDGGQGTALQPEYDLYAAR